MNRRFINETAFNMTRMLIGMIAHEAGEDEHRQRFEQVFETCRAGLMSYCQQIQRRQHTINPTGGSHVSATATAGRP